MDMIPGVSYTRFQSDYVRCARSVDLVATTFSAPRQFVVSDRGEPRRASTPEQISHVLDVLYLGGDGRTPREWVVGLDAVGQISIQPVDANKQFFESAQAQLAYHDAASGLRTRFVDVRELHLMNLQVLEQPERGGSGLDDPVHLYGTLLGPVPTENGHPVPAANGQLTVSRGGVLQAFVDGANWSFEYEGESQRCYHLCVPADRTRAVESGTGLVLAYPLMPPDMALQNPANGALVNQMIFDLLAALQEQWRNESVAPELVDLQLPVPNRSAFASKLEGKGYEIDGDRAVREDDSGGGLGGFFSNVFGVGGEEVQIPPEGSTDDYRRLAKRFLDAADDWPRSATN